MDPNAPPRIFTFFPKLPLEMQFMIWNEAANIPRYVDIWHRPIFHRDSEIPCLANALISFTKVPTVLHVCQNSRKEALKHYTHFRAWEWKCKHDYSSHVQPKIYINWNADVICAMDTSRSEEWLRILYRNPLLRRIAINCAETSPSWIHYLPIGITDVLFYNLNPPLNALDFIRCRGNFQLDFTEFFPMESELSLHTLLYTFKAMLEKERWIRNHIIEADSLNADALNMFTTSWNESHPEANVEFKRVLVNGVMDLDRMIHPSNFYEALRVRLGMTWG